MASKQAQDKRCEKSLLYLRRKTWKKRLGCSGRMRLWRPVVGASIEIARAKGTKCPDQLESLPDEEASEGRLSCS